MAITFNSKEEVAKYFDFIVMTKADEIRLEKAWSMWVEKYRADGVVGCMAEMLTATPNSKKSTISNAGKTDCFIRYRTENGIIVPVRCESKINGGRIQTIESEYSKAEEINGKFIVYRFDICNANTSNLRRHCPPLVFPRVEFVNYLYTHNLVKKVNHKSKTVGYAIQVTSKAWFEFLSDYPIVWDRTAVYSDNDFDGLF